METSHPGNIGAAARAIKTMGFGRLVLVNPRSYPSDEATTRAAGAADVLESAEVVSSLDAAIAGCHLVVGTSVRDRSVAWPTQTPREMVSHAMNFVEESTDNQLAIVFGRERTGLENSELDKTQIQVRIPANPEYGSLNVASAVQILAYELNAQITEAIANSEANTGSENSHQMDAAAVSGKDKRQRFASADELRGYYEHLQTVLERLDFVRESPPTKLMRKVTRLYNRAQVNVEELNILRGMLTAVENKLEKDKDSV